MIFVIKYYLELNPDLNKNSTEYELKNHYLKYGIKEKRYYRYKDKLPYDFNWIEYLNLNYDLVGNIKDEKQAIIHYVKHGINENRIYKYKLNNNIKYDYKYYKNNDEFNEFNVSVIVPNFNNSKYIIKRLESIL